MKRQGALYNKKVPNKVLNLKSFMEKKIKKQKPI